MDRENHLRHTHFVTLRRQEGKGCAQGELISMRDIPLRRTTGCKSTRVPQIACLRMDNGWQLSSDAWIADMGEQGDFGRRYVLDPIMLPRALARKPRKALDVGCGEGRFCRMLKKHRIDVTGVDPTPGLLEAASARDAEGTYLEATAERLPFTDKAFDLVVSYLSLIDIPDIRAAIQEMARVLAPGGALLIANLNSFNTRAATRVGSRTAPVAGFFIRSTTTWRSAQCGQSIVVSAFGITIGR
jgi:SAM-dependent methyltransferase